MSLLGGIRGFLFGSSDSLLVSRSVEECVDALQWMPENYAPLLAPTTTTVESRKRYHESIHVKVYRLIGRTLAVEWEGDLSPQQENLTLVEGKVRFASRVLGLHAWLAVGLLFALAFGTFFLAVISIIFYGIFWKYAFHYRAQLRRNVIDTLSGNRISGKSHRNASK